MIAVHQMKHGKDFFAEFRADFYSSTTAKLICPDTEIRLLDRAVLSSLGYGLT
jgi:hypothetical protein